MAVRSYGYMTLLNDFTFYGHLVHDVDISQATLVEFDGLDSNGFAKVKPASDTQSEFEVVKEVTVYDRLPGILVKVRSLASPLMFVENQWDYNNDWEYNIDVVQVGEHVRAHKLSVGECFIMGPYEDRANGEPIEGSVFTVEDINNRVFETESKAGEVIEDLNDTETFDEKYQLGDTFTFKLAEEGFVTCTLVAIDADDLSNGQGKAHTTWLANVMLGTWARMNPAFNDNNGTGTMGGYNASEMNDYVQSLIADFPADLKTSIKTVDKYHRAFVDGDTENAVEQKAQLKLWIPSATELYGPGAVQTVTSGPTYTKYINRNSRRVKKNTLTGEASRPYWLRDANSKNNFHLVTTAGELSANPAYYEYGVVIGFCM